MKELRPFSISLVIWLLALVACNQSETANTGNTQYSQQNAETVEDKHSFAIPDQVAMTHLALDIQVDFSRQCIKGTAEVFVKQGVSDKPLLLDTKNLKIFRVRIGESDVPYELHEEIMHLGSALEIKLPPGTASVVIEYETEQGSEALQWLTAQQTLGRSAPFLFTQSQAILARSWIPCQDSPGIRFTYEARVQVPQGMLALMSATNPKAVAADGVYHFKMEKPIPAYLLALAVGDVVFQEIGPRTGVYAEKGMLDKAVYEMADLEKMLEAAERLYGPYLWGRYDVIVLPPSFPFGGMENPMLTFATPTILAGDRSLVSLIAHELAHSWSGNLVTNATWNDFWLNEGFTVYFEYRIMEQLYGQDFADMLALISYGDLLDALKSMEYGEDTKLKLNLAGRNPDDGVSPIAYDKGYFFLKLIEQTVGREAWDAFLLKYFEQYAFSAIATEEFLRYLNKHLLQAHEGAWDEIGVEQWVYGSGLPDNCPKIQSARFDMVEKEAAAFMAGKAVNNLKTTGWYYQEWVHFLRLMPDTLSNYQMSMLDNAFGFTASGNSEILFEWLMMSIRHNYRPAFGQLESFLFEVGRRKFIAPLYAALSKDEKNKELAREIYAKSRENYHFVATATIDRILE